jgi:hypothetical protein
VRLRTLLPFVCSAAFTLAVAQGAETPTLVEQNGHHALLVDGKPFLVLGGQINNSSSWPATMPDVWATIEGMHANTVEAPVYWEQMEPQPGQFDFSTVDMLVTQARQHNVHLDLLWFGTWKNGEDHYVPEWMKTNPQKYPRMIDERGQPVQVMSANSTVNLDADRTAFRALMHHLKTLDGEQHTVILVQVENESGAIDAVRDHSPAAEREFNGAVPAALVKALGVHAGTWREVFGPEADERFQAWSVASYINQVARAGKAEMPLPMYCNVWPRYPKGYEIRGHDLPGYDYPSGGPMEDNIAIWKAAAPNIDMLGPDIYSDDPAVYEYLLNYYDRPDNPVWIPETGLGDGFAKAFFWMLDRGGIGFSPFGTDQTDWTLMKGQLPKLHAENYRLFAPMDREIAQLLFEGKVHTATEEPGQPQTSLALGRWKADIRFGFPQPDGEAHAPGTPDQHGRVMVAQLAPDQFLLAGFDTRVTFYLAKPGANEHRQILRAEEGDYQNGQWHFLRILNGDQTDRGINLRHEFTAVKITLGTY